MRWSHAIASTTALGALLGACSAPGVPNPPPTPSPVVVPVPTSVTVCPGTALPPGYVCAPPPPSAICKYAPNLLSWGQGWIAKHFLTTADITVFAALQADIVQRCTTPAGKAVRSTT